MLTKIGDYEITYDAIGNPTEIIADYDGDIEGMYLTWEDGRKLVYVEGIALYHEGGGTTAIAIYAVLMYSSDLCWPLLYGISDSLAPAIGYNWGAESYDRVKRIVRCGYIGTACVGLISTCVLFFFPNAIASLFVGEEEALLFTIAPRAIRLFCFAYLFRWFVVTTQGFLSAIEKPILATTMSVSVALVFPVTILGALWSFGLDGVWFNFVGVNALAAILGAVLLLRIRREIRSREAKKLEKTEKTAQEVSE